jgi:hypothetical protein
VKLRRRDENEIFRRGRIFQFLRLRRELAFLLGFFRGGDGLAQRARMLTVERFGNGLSDGLRAEIVREHRRPRNRSQRGPVQACRQDDGDHHQKLSVMGKHR